MYLFFNYCKKWKRLKREKSKSNNFVASAFYNRRPYGMTHRFLLFYSLFNSFLPLHAVSDQIWRKIFLFAFPSKINAKLLAHTPVYLIKKGSFPL
jgi:hypothetical protein